MLFRKTRETEVHEDRSSTELSNNAVLGSAAYPCARDESSTVDLIGGAKSSFGSTPTEAVELGMERSAAAVPSQAIALTDLTAEKARKRAGNDSDESEKLGEPLSAVQSAVMHLAKATADEKIKDLAAKEENNEMKAARKHADISEEIRKNSAANLAAAEKEADDEDKLVSKLNQEAAEHEARARAAMARAAAIDPSSDYLSQLNELISQLEMSESIPTTETDYSLDI